MTSHPRIPRGLAALPASMTAHAVDAKAALRKELLATRHGITPEQKEQWDAAIGARILQWWRSQEEHGATLLGVYWPLRGEPDLHPAYARLAACGVQLALPVVLARDAPLGFAYWNPGEAMQRDAMGVAIPALARTAPVPDALLVPCLGFNGAGYRLGYGGGYYDRTLALAARPATAGVAYACQGASFDAAAHDVALDVILTEAG